MVKNMLFINNGNRRTSNCKKKKKKSHNILSDNQEFELQFVTYHNQKKKN